MFLGTLGMGFGLRNKIFASWAGLRGAVPIVLATYLSAAGLDVGNEIFNLVVFAILLSIITQGSTLGAVAKWLKLARPTRPTPLFNLELITLAPSDYDVYEIDLPGPQGVSGSLIQDLNLPAGAVIALVTRGEEVVVPKGNTRLYGGEHVSVLAHSRDEHQVRKALHDPFRIHTEDESGPVAPLEPSAPA